MKRAKFSYNIQNFNSERVIAVNFSKNKLITDVMMFFYKFSCHHSNLIITVGKDLVQTAHNRFKGKNIPNTVMINNWIDKREIYPVEVDYSKVVAFKENYGLKDKFVIMYYGNICLYYDLKKLMKVIK